MSLNIYYDGDCPVCAHYNKHLRLKKSAGSVTLHDLREQRHLRDELIGQGFDLDKGMVVEIDGRRVGGADAVNALAMLSSPVDGFNKFNKLMLSSPLMAKFLYPILRAGRWLILFFLGRSQIMEEDEGAVARSSIFSTLFALFSFFHFLNYTLQYNGLPPDIDMIAILISAGLLFFNPHSARLLFLLMFTSTISAYMQAPVQSNHTIVRNFVLLGYWVSFVYGIFKGVKWSDIFTNFSVAGQGVLLVMYFFGVFHKLNTGFLNLETSCAVALWRKMPDFLNWIDFTAMHYLAIYGTFAVEMALVFMLLFPRYRHIAIVCGIGFHLILGLSSFTMYISFTTLAIALHCLFLNKESSLQIQNSLIMEAITVRKKNIVYIVSAFLLVLLVVASALLQLYSLVTIFMIPVLLPFCYAIIRHGASKKPLLDVGHRYVANSIGGFVIVAFFFNCWMPYLGLKTAQNVNMFSNLRLEAGKSNHIIMSSAPKPFKYLEDVVFIEKSETTNGKGIALSTYDDRSVIYYDVLAKLEDNPDLTISYRRGGEFYENMTAEKLADDIDNILHPAWFRKWFHFQRADLSEHQICR